MGGSGVQRPLKFAKYLKEFGWNPIILCPEPGAYHTFDESLQQELDSLDLEVHRVSGNTPFHKTGKRRQVNLPGWLENKLRKVSTFFWLPDNKKGWINSAYKKALEIIESKNIEAIFSTANPYSNLILAKRLKEKTKIPVLMDLRDEWLESHLLKYPTKWHRKKMAQIEKDTLSSADILTVINEGYKKSFQERFKELDIRVLNQGFDPEDFNKIKNEVRDNNKIKILYSGLFYGERTPYLFLKAVRSILDEFPEIKESIELQFQGGLSKEVKNWARHFKLEKSIVDHGYLPHKKAIHNLMKADVLWLMIGHMNNSELVTVGKMFEYFGTKKPILALVPNGSSRVLLDNYNAAYYAHPFKEEEIIEVLKELIKDFQNSKLPKANSEFINKFNRRIVTAELANLLDELSAKNKSVL
ncbi:MAG: hypothetical protein ABJH08_00405 [Balneola sp.]